ncbi:MAG: hypothetical protein HC902_08220 [Calothrix sp. SM1_5_4]|nr:hypothetical protein [Calothrix sp. SM1_5_4]
MRDILQMPFVMEHQERQNLQPGELKLVERQITLALKKCQLVRAKEGVMLKKELLGQLKELEVRVRKMASWRDEAMKGAQQRLKSRLVAIEAEQLDASRLALETALWSTKWMCMRRSSG